MSDVRTRTLAAGVVAAFAFAFVALSPPQASAATLPICSQYPDLPECQDDPAGTAGPGPGADQGRPTGESDGSLPFTGYPLTALVLLLLVLLLAGLTIRAYLAVRGRIAGNGRPPTGSG